MAHIYLMNLCFGKTESTSIIYQLSDLYLIMF